MIEVTPEATPNPNAVKFTLDRPSTDGRTETFRAGLRSRRVTARGAHLRARRRDERVHDRELRQRHQGGRRRLERARAPGSSTSSRPTSPRPDEPDRRLLLVRDRAIFAVGGILFLRPLDDNRFLFGVPYLLVGLIILGGVAASQRRVRRRAAPDRDRGPGSRPTPY